MIAAAGVSAAEPSAMLAQPGPQRGPAAGGQRVGADAHDPAVAIGADLAVLAEEVDTAAGPPGGPGAVAQPDWPSLTSCEVIQQEVELVDVRVAVPAHGRSSTVVPGG